MKSRTELYDALIEETERFEKLAKDCYAMFKEDDPEYENPEFLETLEKLGNNIENMKNTRKKVFVKELALGAISSIGLGLLIGTYLRPFIRR